MVALTFNSEDIFLNRAKIVMKYMGVWIPPLNESLISKCYKYFMIILQYLFLIFQIIYMFQVWGDLDAVSQAMYLLFTQASLCFKVSVFHFNQENIRRLLEQMNCETFGPQSAIHEKILYSQATRIKRMLMSFMISSQTTCGLWCLKPLFDDVGRQFPFDMWMPLSPEHSPQYETGFAFQLVTICLSAYMYFGVDSVALSMVIFACAQIDIIKDKIMSITTIKYGLQSEERRKKLEDNHKRLIECITQHQAVYDFTKLVERTFHSYLLFQITGCVGIFCMTALRILVVDWRSMQFFSSISYLFVMVSQLYVCCWCGHELTDTTVDLHTVMYKCAWYEQDVRFRRDLCFAMMRMRRPMAIRAGYYISLSRQTFISILRMSYSYFAVLNQTTTKA